MSEVEFIPWPKLARLVREVVITEKIDGTNAAIVIPESESDPVLAQSRTRFIKPGADNAGFAAWVYQNARDLRDLLGPGLHFGEWYGVGIGRGYGLQERRLALFNTERWGDGRLTDTPRKLELATRLRVAPTPVIATGPFCDATIDQAFKVLSAGSVAAPGFLKPEGFVLFHKASRTMYKWTYGGDGNKGTPVDAHGNHVQCVSVCTPSLLPPSEPSLSCGCAA